jgi:hypothetical protein
MKESRQRQLLEGQSSVARKVFEGVPIQEAWHEKEIITAVRTAGVTIAAHTVRGCLLDMKDVGLIKEPHKGMYQREPVQKFLRLPEVKDTLAIQQITIEPTMTAKTYTPAKAQTVTPLDLLGTVATELTLLASEFGERLRALALRVEEVALSVEAQREDDAKIIAKANQLKDLLKGFGE